jgi:hypothetical protein
MNDDYFAYYLIGCWGYMLENVKTRQNSVAYNDLTNVVPSLMKAKTCPLKSARKLESLVTANHDKIMEEIETLMNTYEGIAMADVDDVQSSFIKGSKDWKTLWVKFLNGWAGTADDLPTLRDITKEMGDDVTLLHVSILRPGMRLPPHKGIHAGVWRYHYGLTIPEGDTGLNIEGSNFKWKEGEGVIWDDSLMHSAWNMTNENRLIIFADLPRDLNPIASYINRLVINVAQCTKRVKRIKKLIKTQNT